MIQTLLPWMLLGICILTLVGMFGAAFHAADRRALLGQSLWAVVFIVYTRAMLPASDLPTLVWIGVVAGFCAILAPVGLRWRRIPLFTEETSRLRRLTAATEWTLLSAAVLIIAWTFF